MKELDYYRTQLPGPRLQKLPKLIRPLAIFARNTLRLTIAQKKYDDVKVEVRRKLSFGVRYVYGADVKGDIAEFGTASGATATAIARTMAECETGREEPRRLHLFDSFQGLPKAESDVDAKSPHVQSGIWGAGTCFSLTKEELFAVCAVSLPKERILIYEGWFKDTLPRIPKDTVFAMLHIDCDLYQSAKDVLDHFFSHGLVQDGAAIFFDDWNSNAASPTMGERRAWAEMVEKHGIEWSDGGEYGDQQKKVIVHSYNRNVPA